MASTNYSITTIKNGIFPSNTYILIDKKSEDAIIIDPGLDFEAIKTTEEALKIKPIAIISTHGHFDHIGNVAYLQKKYDIPFYLHEKDIKISKAANFYLKMSKLPMIEIPKPDFLFEGKELKVVIGPFTFNIYNFPGHTDGSCLIKLDNNIFSGDIIYKSGLGFNHFPGEDKLKLKDSVKEIFTLFQNDVMIYPGHGSSVSLQEIRTQNTELIDFINS